MYGMDTPAGTPAEPWPDPDPVLEAFSEVCDPVTAGYVIKSLADSGLVVAPVEKALDAVDLTGADVLVLHTHEALDSPAVEKLTRTLADRLPEQGLILIMRPGESLEALTDEDMARLGWVRKDTSA